MDIINELMAQIYDFLDKLIHKIDEIFGHIQDMINPPQPLD